MQRIGIYGGSFNPVHFGHIGLAKWIIENTDLDELWFLISPNNPLKSAQTLAPEQERLAAVQQAIQDIPRLKASDFEFTLPRPSYTANTLRALQQAYPTYEFTLIIGEDNLSIFHQWREYEYILANFRIFVYPRHAKGPNNAADIHDNPSMPWSDIPVKDLQFLSDAPYFDISSTEIRAKLLSQS